MQWVHTAEGEYKRSVLGEYSHRRALEWKLRITESFIVHGRNEKILKIDQCSPRRRERELDEVMLGPKRLKRWSEILQRQVDRE